MAFTGSYPGGAALQREANARPRPIPSYGELGSINPVVALSGHGHGRNDDGHRRGGGSDAAGSQQRPGRRAVQTGTLEDFDAASRHMSVIASIRPSGNRYLTDDFFYASRLPALLQRIREPLHTDARTVNGSTLVFDDRPAGCIGQPFSRQRRRPPSRPPPDPPAPCRPT